ncbi:MAG: pitrilysin family protein [Chloroflexi bacterium]|nr:pitrilysin family protein [Chloroflexota bacterium]MDA1220166.1 pitrilysin family protein [Chloroflexota bacterium]
MVSIAFDKITLANGLDVILHEDHTVPVVAVNVWYHVGSKDEQMGRTGFAHLFEHVMFEGSKHHNKSHFEPLQKAGANLNGSTTSDRTNYWEDVPTNYLELALWLEADRMGFLLDALDQQRFDIQRDVVKNERRQSYENRPYGMAHWHIQEALFPLPHPYHWMTIGSQEDLDAANLDDIKDFFRRFYSPSNSSLAIAGDIDRAQTLELVNKYFGDLPPGPQVQRIGRFDSSLPGRVELQIHDKVSLPRVYIAWATPPHFSADDAPLELLQAVLADGLSSRLYRSLVYEKQIAQSVSVRYHASEIAGQFIIEGTAAANHDVNEVEQAIEAEMERIRREPPTEEEITRAKNRLEAHHYRQLSRVGGFGGKADALNHYNVYKADPNLINTEIDNYMAVRQEDILRVSESVLDHRQVRLKVLPEASLASATTGVDRSIMPGPAKEPSFVPPVPQRRTLPNGMGVAVVEQRGLPIVAFALLFNTGATADPQNLPGLASMTTQLMPEGTETRTSQEIAIGFEFIGARLSNETRRESTIFSSETLTKHWPTVLDLMADVVLHPTFPEHELERVRREHLTDLRRAKDDATFIAGQVMPGLIFGRDSGYGHPADGTIESVTALTQADLKRHYLSHFGPSATTLIVAGDVSLDEVMAKAQAAFGEWANPMLEPPATLGAVAEDPADPTTIYLVDKPGAAQSVIRAGHTTVPRNHDDYFKLVLLNYAFGGQFSARLNQNLRQDKGYSYGFNSSISWYSQPSLLVAGGSVQTEVTKESVVETLKEFRDVHSARPISNDELNGARDGFSRGYPAGFERPGQVLGQVIQLLVHGLPDDYFQTVSRELSGVTLEQVRQTGVGRVHPDALTVLVVGDRQVVEPGLRELGLPVVLLDSDGGVIS